MEYFEGINKIFEQYALSLTMVNNESGRQEYLTGIVNQYVLETLSSVKV